MQFRLWIENPIAEVEIVGCIAKKYPIVNGKGNQSWKFCWGTEEKMVKSGMCEGHIPFW